MLNVRVFALVALATFAVAAVLRALGPPWVVRSLETAPAPAWVERVNVSGAAPTEAASGVAARAEERMQSSESRAEGSSAERSSAGRSSSGRSSSGRWGSGRWRSRAVLVRAAAPPSGGLQAEQRQLEVVQKALEKGHGAAAARALDEYGAVLPSGELRLEAELLRIDVALARGERDRALELARAFDSQPGAERYKERLAALIGGTAREEPQTAWMGSR